MYKLWWPVIWQTTKRQHCLAVNGRTTVIFQQLQTAVTAPAAVVPLRSSHSEVEGTAAAPISQSEVEKLLDAAVKLSHQAKQSQQRTSPSLPTRTACETIISLAEAANSPDEGMNSSRRLLQEDDRFKQLLTALEANAASQLEPLAIVRNVAAAVVMAEVESIR